MTRRFHAQMNHLTGGSDALQLRRYELCIRLLAAHRRDHRGQIRNAPRLFARHRSRPNRGEGFFGIAIVSRKRQHADDQRRQSEQCTGQ